MKRALYRRLRDRFAIDTRLATRRRRYVDTENTRVALRVRGRGAVPGVGQGVAASRTPVTPLCRRSGDSRGSGRLRAPVVLGRFQKFSRVQLRLGVCVQMLCLRPGMGSARTDDRSPEPPVARAIILHSSQLDIRVAGIYINVLLIWFSARMFFASRFFVADG